MNQNEARQDFAEELAAWLGPVLVEVGLVPTSDDARLEDLCDLLAAECQVRPTVPLRKFAGHFSGYPRHDMGQMTRRDLLIRAADFVRDVRAFSCVRQQEEGDKPFNATDYYAMEDLETALRESVS